MAEVPEKPVTNHTSHNLSTESRFGEPVYFSSANNRIGNEQSEESPEVSLETYTKRLLYFDFSSWEMSEVVSEVGPTRKYWTLEDLKDLLEERIKSWHLNSQEQPNCKHSRSIKSNTITLQQASKVETQSRNDRIEVIQTVEPSYEDMAFTAPEIFHKIDKDGSEKLEQECPCWSPRGDEECHDFMDFDQELTASANFAELINHEHPAIYAGDSCQNYDTEMDWKYDEPLVLNTTENDLIVDKDEDLDLHALDAAYDMIVDSDKGSIDEAPDDGRIGLTEDALMRENEAVDLIQQGHQPWGISDKGCSLFPTFFSGAAQYKSAQPNFGRQESNEETCARGNGQQPCTRNPQEMEYYTRQFPAWRQGRSGQQTADVLGPEEEFLHGLKGFWRQNKLY
ncbi:hypothetical protein P170DRAFT_472605 [Aspergillus steynii IBT 23096]|uniref:Uncharacterized protein n=1 Tax=Aspergillus steynii IBT 23096 TaxID=1392250 RepID=A0A2I2GIK0_9EURO|nr:uncharacterized protein P170DRAFT_472605 [Aspergillus steynii IBT 23096]PLB52715.1 hypothetical protein P170DRAFT_472605 [Aspergillus steynii IBT 23096]